MPHAGRLTARLGFAAMKYPFYDLDIPNEGSLHHIENEKDACGVGFVANIEGKRSRAILDLAINGVCNVQHRGAVDADRVTGDGAGVLTQIPHKIFQPFIDEMHFELDHPMDLAVGVFFMPTDQTERMKIHLLAEGLLRNRDIQVIGWRDVPVNPNELGHKARLTMPVIQQLLVARPEGMDDNPFERQLYLIRREMRLKARIHKLADFYIASFSHRTIVYKALLLPSSLQKFYTDLQSDDYETAFAIFHQRFSTNTFPTWALSHPFRTLAHNGEINTVRGNRNWLNSRASDFENVVWEGEEQLLKELITKGQSDSASLDAALDLLVQSGRDPVHALAMLVPSAYGIDPTTSAELKAFYEYHECFSEPWDGPAALVFTNDRACARAAGSSRATASSPSAPKSASCPSTTPKCCAKAASRPARCWRSTSCAVVCVSMTKSRPISPAASLTANGSTIAPASPRSRPNCPQAISTSSRCRKSRPLSATQRRNSTCPSRPCSRRARRPLTLWAMTRR
jgi:glutamate synthase (NADPH/NADH) large chain/glutamate synthase (ferredoxin)